jgi:hypothetical protein
MSGIADIIFMVVAIFVLAVVIVIALLVYDSFMTSTTVTTIFTPEQIAMTAPAKTAISMFDYLAVFIVVGIGVMCAISAAMVRTHPVFFVVMLIVQMIIVGISSVISNVWYQFAQASALLPETNSLVWLPFIFQNLPTIILVFSSIVAIVSYGAPAGNRYAYQ